MITLSGEKVLRIDEEAVLALLPELTFIRFYDAAPRGAANSIDPIDWGVPSLLAAPVSYPALKLISDDYVAKVNSSLKACSSRWRLEDEDKDGARREAVRRLLSDVCSIDGVKKAIATKILHKKRPNLIPIIDSVVVDFYASKKSLPTDVIFDKVKPDLILNALALRKLSDEAAVLPRPIHVTPLRLVEMIVWLQAKKGGNVADRIALK
jgi:hypothetical protein